MTLTLFAPIAGISVIAGALGVLGYLAFGGGTWSRRQALFNLNRGLPGAPVVNAPVTRVHLVPGLARKLASKATVGRLERWLIQAGRPAGWSVDGLLSAKVLLLFGVGALGLVYASAVRTPLAWGLAIFTVVLAFFGPDLIVVSRGQTRRQQMTQALPDTLDQMSIAVEAGLAFDAAMVRVARNGSGPLVDELVRTLQDIQVGQSRRVAFEALALRAGVPDLRRFVRSTIQAEEYGIPLAEVLNQQAKEMRVRRRQRAEEKAMGIPVKVVFPLLLFILPVLFIVLLGPAVMNIVEAFSR